MTINEERTHPSGNKSTDAETEQYAQKVVKPPFYKNVWFWVSMCLIGMFIALTCYGSWLNENNHNDNNHSSNSASSSVNTSVSSSSPASSSIASSKSQNSVMATSKASASRNIALTYGKLVDVKENNDVLILKAKIESQATNKQTVDQNYYNVVNYIEKQDMAGINELQYWAVAKMQNGDEAKVISFTVPKSVIDRIKAGNFPANQLGNYVDDLWILSSLRN